jgi:hypothetical protein
MGDRTCDPVGGEGKLGSHFSQEFADGDRIVAAESDQIVFVHEFLFNQFPAVFPLDRRSVTAPTIHKVVVPAIRDCQFCVKPADLIVSIFEHYVCALASYGHNFHGFSRRIGSE